MGGICLKAAKFRLLGVVMAALLVLGMLAGCNRAGKAPQGTSGLSGTIVIAGSTSVQPLSEELAAAFREKHPDVDISVAGGGSSAGIKAAQEGTAYIGASSRELKPDEKGTVFETLIAKDGIAVVVHPGNAVDALSLDQVRKIFAGEITNWKDVGGSDAAINVYTREEGSGTRGAFEEIVMGEDTKISSKAGVQNSTGAVRTAVAGDPNGIGYISLGSVNKAVKALKIDGVEPSKETVLNGSYRIARPFLYLTKGKPTGLVKAYIDFVLSPEGQKIVEQDFIPVK